MNDLVYPRERILGSITLVLGLLVWLGLIVGTVGALLIGLAVGYLVYLFAQSALIAHIKGNGVELSEQQYPELYAQFVSCCDRLQLPKRPVAYILNGNGGLNAFATKFLGAQYVVLMSDIVDAVEDNPDGVRFYIGHELGHLRMKHLTGQLLRWPVLWLPLLGGAYSRAKEYTSDRHGRACCASPEGAARALAVLSAGVERWKHLDVPTYIAQMRETSGFWMSFHELNAAYPWLTKRFARIIDPSAPVPGRNGLSYFLSAFVPFAGRLGGGFGMLVMIYIIGVLAAIAIPTYQEFQTRAQLVPAVEEARRAADAVTNYYYANHAVPATLAEAGYLPSDNHAILQSLDFNPDSGVIEITLGAGPNVGKHVQLVGSVDKEKHVRWQCRSEEIKQTLLPLTCRE